MTNPNHPLYFRLEDFKLVEDLLTRVFYDDEITPEESKLLWKTQTIIQKIEGSIRSRQARSHV